MKIQLSGIGLLLTIIFMVLKLCNVIAWSWWWVFAPMWISFAAFVTFMVFCFGIVILHAAKK